MRHGRKSRSVLFDGYKRHVLRDLDTGLVPAVGDHPGQRAGGQRHRRHRRGPGGGRVAAGRAAHRPGLPVLGAGPRPRPGPGRLLQGLAGPQHRRPVRQGPVQPRLRRRAADLPGRGGHAVRARQDRPLPEKHLRGLPAAGRAAPPAATGAASPSTPTRRCWPSCASASTPRKGARNCANASQSSTHLRMSGTGRAAAPATSAPARTCSTCDASPSSTTSTSSPARPSPTVTS